MDLKTKNLAMPTQSIEDVISGKNLAEYAESNHTNNRESLIKKLLNFPINRLVSNFLIEMDAKNEAYYFIMQYGHFDAFRDYCLKEKEMEVNNG